MFTLENSLLTTQALLACRSTSMVTWHENHHDNDDHHEHHEHHEHPHHHIYNTLCYHLII